MSKTVDRTLTHTNDYHGGPRSARAFWNAFEEELATEHQTVIHRKDGTTVTRAFRKDGVPLAGVIINPPDEVMSTWDEATRARFVDDSMEVMEEFEPRLFSRSHVRAHVTHNDEGGDHHLLYDTFDDDGHCNGNLLDAQLLHRLCEVYPAAMRERGWDLEDLDVTDWERMKTDEEYAAERRQKLKDGRLNTNEYARRKNEEAAQAAVEARIAAEEAARDALQRQLEATRAAQRVREEADISIEAAREAARVDMEHAALMIELAAEQDAQALRDAILDDAEADANSIREDARADADAERRRLRRDVDDAARQVAMAQKEADTIVETAYKDATPTVANIPPGAFLERCFSELVELARPKRNPMANMVDLSDEPHEDMPEMSGDPQVSNALRFVQRFFKKIGKTIKEFGDEVARKIMREQGMRPTPSKRSVAEAERADKEFYANLVFSKTEAGGVSRGRGGRQIGE